MSKKFFCLTSFFFGFFRFSPNYFFGFFRFSPKYLFGLFLFRISAASNPHKTCITNALLTSILARSKGWSTRRHEKSLGLYERKEYFSSHPLLIGEFRPVRLYRWQGWWCYPSCPDLPVIRHTGSWQFFDIKH